MRGGAAFPVVGVVLCLAGCKGSSRTAASSTDAGVDAAPSASASLAAALDAAPADDLIPATSSDELTARARHLLEAIAKDDPDLATDIEFPRDGWMALRDATDPGKEWDKRVDRPFRHGLHVLSRHHLDGAQFVSLELGHAVVQEPTTRHGWKKPLWTVHGSRLTYVVEGHTRTVSIHEMTAWRGAWYVTRLR
jgi:hypothetical protein